MNIRAGLRMRLTLSGAGSRTMVSLNRYVVTQPAIEGVEPSPEAFTYDVTPWLHAGHNVLTVVLIGPRREIPFRLVIEEDGYAWPRGQLDEDDFEPSSAPWRFWAHEFWMPAAKRRRARADVSLRAGL